MKLHAEPIPAAAHSGDHVLSETAAFTGSEVGKAHVLVCTAHSNASGANPPHIHGYDKSTGE